MPHELWLKLLEIWQEHKGGRKEERDFWFYLFSFLLYLSSKHSLGGDRNSYIMSNTAKRFEDLIIWQKARALTKAVYEATRSGAFVKDFGLAGQIQRSAVSAMSNIAEGYERGGRAEFHQFLSIAKSSCGEVRSQLYVALDVGYLQQADFERLRIQAEEISRMIGKFQVAVYQQKEERGKVKEER
jgi:four helix bundle protein